MGLDRATIDFLISARDRGVSLDRVLTIGRQGLCVSGKQLRRCLASHGIDLDAAGAERLLSARQGFCEPLLESPERGPSIRSMCRLTRVRPSCTI